MQTVPHKRRPRYRGAHPRRFEEKYKELSPELYATEVEKVLARGQTPAGMHRPICVKEILSIIKPTPGMTGLDATLGYGGHAQELLAHIVPGGKLIGIDVDPLELPKTKKRLRELGYDEDVLIVKRMNFAGIPQLLPAAGKLFDFVIADLGVSSMQIDTPSRGFSFKSDGPLDLRLNPSRGRAVSEMIKTLDVQAIEEILVNNADEPHASLLSRVLFKQRDSLSTTMQLAQVLRLALQCLPRQTRDDEIKKSQQRVFQALRIEANDEFGVLEQFLNLLPQCCAPGARIIILTFHSGEDRRVKKSFLGGLRSGIYSEIARTPVRASPQERNSNPRSSCAKLRWAVRA